LQASGKNSSYETLLSAKTHLSRKIFFTNPKTIMKKIIPIFLVVVFISCGKKEWSKNYVYDDCMKEMKKDKQAADMFS